MRTRRLPESLLQGRRAGKAQCVETPRTVLSRKKRTPQWTPADTHPHAVTRVRHTRAVHAPARVARVTAFGCVSQRSKLVLHLPDHRPCRRSSERDRTCALGKCVETQRNVPSHKKDTTVDAIRHTHIHAVTVSYSLSFHLSLSFTLSLSPVLSLVVSLRALCTTPAEAS